MNHQKSKRPSSDMNTGSKQPTLTIDDTTQAQWERAYLRMKHNEVDQELLNGCYFGNAHLVRKMLKEGANPNAMEVRDGWLPIHYAARWGNIPMLLALIKHGADVNGKNTANETALHKAAGWERKDVAIILLEYGANVGILSKEKLACWEQSAHGDLQYLLQNYPTWKVENQQYVKALLDKYKIVIP